MIRKWERERFFTLEWAIGHALAKSSSRGNCSAGDIQSNTDFTTDGKGEDAQKDGETDKDLRDDSREVILLSNYGWCKKS